MRRLWILILTLVLLSISMAGGLGDLIKQVVAAFSGAVETFFHERQSPIRGRSTALK